MKALLLAAGQGTRLRPLTNDLPKCMVPYNGTTIIDHILKTMRSCGVNNIVIVNGFARHRFTAKDVTYCTNERFESTNMVESLFCAEKHMDTDIIVSYADIIYQQYILQALLDDAHDFSVVIDKDWKKLWELRMEDPLRDAETLKLNADGTIKELGKKPRSLVEINGQYLGLFKIGARALPKVREFYHSLDRKLLYDGRTFDTMYMTTFIQLVIDNLMPVFAVPINGGWIEIDSLDDIDAYTKAGIKF